MSDTNRLDGKIIIITGAAGAIGAAAARVMLARGATVVAVDYSADALAKLAKEFDADDKLVTLSADISDEAAVKAYVDETVKRFGRIDAFFNNAGIEGETHPIPDYPLAAFQKVLAVNVVGVFLGMKYVIPVMAKAGKGSIINTSSVAGLSGSPNMVAYNTSKHAVIGLMRVAAVEWGAKGIRVNTINPGPIESRMMDSLDSTRAANADAIRKATEAAIPAGRYGKPEEVAALAAFLASDDASYINGGIHTVDGGLTAG